MKFDGLTVGMTETTRRTFTREDIWVFRELAPDAAPVHSDQNFARSLGYQDVLVFGLLAAAPFSGLLGDKLPGPQTVIHSVRFSMAAPIYPDEEIEYMAEIKQISASVRVVVLELTATKVEDKTVVMRGQAQCGFRA